jgi:hypothetical protein
MTAAVMDRYDLRCVGALLLTAVGIGLNLAFLQTTTGTNLGRWVLVPIFAGLALGLSGFIQHIREHGRSFVIVDRIWLGCVAYLALSALVSYLFQPRFD